MKSLLFILVLVTSQFTFSQSSTSLQNALTKAKTEHKNVLLYFSGSDWCAPCVKFKKTFINDEAFQTFASKKLVVLNADFPRLKKNALSAEQTKENESLAEQFNSNGLFPLILLLNENGNIIKKWEKLPNETVEEFIAQLQ